MKSGITSFVLLTLPWLCNAQPYSQADYLAMIEQYVERAVNIYDGNWAYSYTTQDWIDNESVTRRIDPSLPFLQSDRILAENGAPPSVERIERHERRMQRRLQRRQERRQDRALVDEEREREGSEKERFMALLIPDSIKLVKQEGELHTIEFRGMEEDRRKIYEHLVGRLVLDTRQQFIRELQVEVIQAFSPYIFMRVNSGQFTMRFELRNGEPVQTDATWELDGHILYIKELDRKEDTQWFDINRVVPDTES